MTIPSKKWRSHLQRREPDPSEGSPDPPGLVALAAALRPFVSPQETLQPIAGPEQPEPTPEAPADAETAASSAPAPRAVRSP